MATNEVEIVVEAGVSEMAPTDDWRVYVPDGRRYLKLLLGGKLIFSAEIVPTTERWHGK